MRTILEDGFALWRQEAEMRKSGHANDVPYTALIPLIGAYVILGECSENANSYTWRQTVLNSHQAMAGLRHSLERFASDLDDDFMVPIEAPDDYISWQARGIDESIHDGLPSGQLSLPWNEEFLAKHLGLAIHDDMVRTKPLRLLDQGWGAFSNHYPQTAEVVRVRR